MNKDKNKKVKGDPNRSRSRDKEKNEVLRFPPINQEQFRAVVIEFMLSDQFDYPISGGELYTYINTIFLTKTSTPYLRNLQIEPILIQLSEAGAINLSKLAVGTYLQDFILSISKEKLGQMNIQYSQEQPKQMPTGGEWIKEEIRSITSGQTFLKIDHLLDEARNQKTNVSLLPKMCSQKKRLIENVGNISLKYEDNVVQLALERKRAALLKTENYDEEEAKRKFTERGLQICENFTRDKCRNVQCQKTHFRKILKANTQTKLGNCTYLDQCPEQEQCKYIHYILDGNDVDWQKRIQTALSNHKSMPPQWINCDLRIFDFRVLGKFDVIMADPPWDIHMNLPYGTLKDKEMKALRVDLLQNDGIIFLWVTGRAMELGRECLILWGYRRVEELVWIKVNQLHRIIRTGRTGHWLNHSKEHCLIGIKGNPQLIKGLDCDVIVSEVRETSRKPDEVYGIINRMCPNGKKVELFGRPHNCRPNWITLGNQLPGVYLKDDGIRQRFMEAYPSVDISENNMNDNLVQMSNQENLNVIYNNHIGKKE
uniref:Putative mRNA N6-adenosine-methyltransferase n=1 Tax=Paramecium tetraurelia TaxID=5888 RepID=Q3SE38_PARTE|nr:Putative mRNA N6-adenosine-methyltransferase [Paramecium tetraurelia]